MSDEMRSIASKEYYEICKLCWKRLAVEPPSKPLPSSYSSVAFSNYLKHHPVSSRHFSASKLLCHHNEKTPDSPKSPKMFDIADNPYFNKYKEKLQKQADTSPEEFKAKLLELSERFIEEQSTKKDDLTRPKENSASPLSDQADNEPTDSRQSKSKSLDDIMKVDLLQDKNAEEISKIWKEYHSMKDGVYGIIKEADFDVMRDNSRKCSSFIFPLPRQDGYEFILSQFLGNEVHFTPLIMFQKMKDNAQPCLSLTHYTDLKSDKGVVLMSGKYDENILSKTEALNLIKQMSMYYGQFAMDRFKLVEKFNHNPSAFEYTELIENYKFMKSNVES